MRVAMAMAPGPVLLLLFRRQIAKIAMRIAMIFVGPLVIEAHFFIIPDVAIAVVGDRRGSNDVPRKR